MDRSKAETAYQPWLVDHAAVIRQPQTTVRGSFALVLLAVCTLMSGCTTRYILGRSDLQDAMDRGAFDQLGVYVTHRTIPLYKRNALDQTRVGREIENRTEDDVYEVRIDRNDVGLIVDHDLRNGRNRLWVSFEPTCREIDCAYGFVQTEDGRFRLVDLPERDDYEELKVYRTWVRDRYELKPGKLKSLSDANAVYRLERKRKKRAKTVFLEVKRKRRKRTNRQVESVSGN